MKKQVNIFIISIIIMIFSCFSLMGQGGGSSGTTTEESPIFKLLSQTGRVIPDVETNSFLVVDYPANLEMIKDYLKMVDVPRKQILIEARVIEVKLAKEHSMGINWSLLTKSFRIGHNLSVYGTDASGAIEEGLWQAIPFRNPKWKPLASGGVDQNPFTLGVFNDNIDIVLKMLTTQLDTNILSAPEIATTNNRRARIDVVKTVPYVEEVESDTDSDTNLTTYTYTYSYADEGVTLSVTPLINSDGSITMAIHPEVKEIVAWHDMPTVPGAATPPQLPETDVRVASTKVTVQPGRTIIIGGLIRNKVEHGVTKVPLLGDLPLLKHMFRSKIDTTEKIELLILVSPTIITPQVLTKMGAEGKTKVGKLYMQEKEKTQKDISKLLVKKETGESLSKEALSQQPFLQKINSKLGKLEEEQKEVVQQRKEIEEKLREEKGEIK